MIAIDINDKWINGCDMLLGLALFKYDVLSKFKNVLSNCIQMFDVALLQKYSLSWLKLIQNHLCVQYCLPIDEALWEVMKQHNGFLSVYLIQCAHVTILCYISYCWGVGEDHIFRQNNKMHSLAMWNNVMLF